MNDELHEALSELHHQLEDLQELDADEREKLAQAVTEIQESLGRLDVKSSDLAKRLHQSTEKFADAHPQLTKTVGQFADMLAQMGI